MTIDASEQIEKFQEFFDMNYKKDIHSQVSKGMGCLIVDFFKLAEFDPKLADQLLEEPEETVKAAEIAVEQFEVKGKFRIRFSNLPSSSQIYVRDTRAKHLAKFISYEGIIRQSSEVRPQAVSAKFECPSCGNTITMPQVDQQFREPTRCTCGRKGRFRLLSKDLVDVQRLVIEESPESLHGGAQPKRLSIFLREDLVEPRMEKRTTPGTRVIVNGVVSEVPIQTRTGGISTRFDLVMNANFIDAVEEDYSEIEIKPEDEQMIKELSKDKKIYEKLVSSIAPSIYGHEKIKQAILLQMFSGVRKIKKDGTKVRGDLHVLLVGDPGCGKSQLLTFTDLVAPKSRYVAGRSASGAGLTCSVVKDEFLRGWALEAGAMVLADNGTLVLDEMDKISSEDTSALHEAMEQQSYHPEFKIMFADGSLEKIGSFVDKLIKKNKSSVIKGKDCEVLEIDDYEILTTNFSKINSTKINRISRHKAPNYFIEVEFSNGRKITVTPEHPFFVHCEGRYKEIAADKLKLGNFIPAPRKLPLKFKEKTLKKVSLNAMNKIVTMPEALDVNFSRFLGYLVTEGHTYYDVDNKYAEVGISNTDHFIINDVKNLYNSIFNSEINTNVSLADKRKNATKDLTTLRLCSVPLYKYFKQNFEGLTYKAPQKYIPNVLRSAEPEYKLEFLRSAFRGDGFIDSERFGYRTASYELAKGYSDLLLSLGCWNYIAKEKKEDLFYYKVVISGSDNMSLFLDKFVEENDYRKERIKWFLDRSKEKLNDRDLIPFDVVKEVYSLLLSLRMADGYFRNNINNHQNAHVKKVRSYLSLVEERLNSVNLFMEPKKLRRKLNITLKELAFSCGCCSATILNLEKRGDPKYLSNLNRLASEKLQKCKYKLQKFRELVNSDLRFVTVKSIKKLKNKEIKWVYDVTVEPNQTFVSEGLVLHNSISVAKANIQATLRTRTSILAAANPKMGRFDPFTPIPQQIDLPPALINRFDLIFVMRDLPNKELDTNIAIKVLASQSYQDEEAEISPDIIRKYLAYVKQKVFPRLTEEAVEEIKNFYVDLRSSGQQGDAAIKPIPISARQLEAVVRLAEASARIKLRDQVTKEDAMVAINLLKGCLAEIGIDPETGNIDIDRIGSGITASSRGNILRVRDVIFKLCDEKQGAISIEDDLKPKVFEKGVTEQKLEEAVEKLKRSGDIFEPKKGWVQKI